MNICVLIIDCLRPDHLGCYGYHKNTSPNIDAIASKGVLFENAYAQTNWTYPSLYSLISSKYPSALNVNWWDKKINKNINVLPEFLAKRGYQTGVFSSFKALLNPSTFAGHFNVSKEVSLDNNAVPEFQEWVDENENSFLLFHTSEYVHEPYNADKEYVSRFLEADEEVGSRSDVVKCLTAQGSADANMRNIIGKLNKRLISLSDKELRYLLACYDAGIYYVDSIVGKMHRIIKESGKDYMFMLIADHGQAFQEHGYFAHGLSLYDEILKVPLIVDYNGSHSLKVSEAVQLMDIFPSILDVLGMKGNFKMEGSSFAPAFNGKKITDKAIFSEGYPHVSIRDEGYKLISAYSKFWSHKEILSKFNDGTASGSWKRDLMSFYLRFCPDKLYNIQDDKEEKTNLIRKEKEIHRKLKLKLKNILERILREDLSSSSETVIDDEMEKQLKSLGYL